MSAGAERPTAESSWLAVVGIPARSPRKSCGRPRRRRGVHPQHRVLLECSLVAIHLAAQALLAGDCDMALAGA